MNLRETKGVLVQSVAALKHRNFRLFWLGQCVSLIGTWMQNVAQAWLVTEIAKSNAAIWLGRITAIQFLPILFFSLFIGILIDRFSKKKMLIFTQTVMLVLALVLAFDILWHTVALWHVVLIAFMLGCINTLDMPTRQAFMIELVGKAELTNAIVLNSSIFNLARIIGPAVAGFVIARWGMDACFFLNALSFIPVIIGISMIRLMGEEESMGIRREKPNMMKEIIEGLTYVLKSSGIMIPLAILAVIIVFAFNFMVLAPLYAKNIFHGDAQTLGILMAAFGVGALGGSVIMAMRSRKPPSLRLLAVSAMALCILELVMVPVRSLSMICGLLALIGFAMIACTTSANSLIQMQSPNRLRGRIMSIYVLVFIGFSPFGSYGTGLAAHYWGAPAALGIGAGIGLGLILALLLVRRFLMRSTCN